MRKLLVVLALAVLPALGATAQEAIDPVTYEQGRTLYDTNCQLCHKKDGKGTRDVFPALAGNENLADIFPLVSNAHQGGAVMPPFPALDDAALAALASYVRNSWGNSFGGVTAEEVAAVRADLDPPLELLSIWDGIYTQEQADRGKAVYGSPCGLCHGGKLNGVPDDQDMRPAPPLSRAKFLRVWDGRSLGMLYSYTRWTMPQSNPGFLPEEDYLAIVAHMLSTTGVPAGDTPLSGDIRELGRIIIRQAP